MEKLPKEWSGKLLLGDYSFTASSGAMVNRAQYQQHINDISNLLNQLNDPRVRWFDGYGISKEHRMYAQNGEEYVGQSQHFHESCSVQSEADPDNSMVVCSNITEMIGQVLLGEALGPKSEFLEQVSFSNWHLGGKQKKVKEKPTPAPLRWCHACPHCMLPFHLSPHPEMECKSGPFDAIPKKLLTPQGRYTECFEKTNQAEGEVDRMTCPADCLNTPHTSSFETESDTVYVRQCPLE